MMDLLKTYNREVTVMFSLWGRVWRETRLFNSDNRIASMIQGKP